MAKVAEATARKADPMLKLFDAARLASVPIVALRSADQNAAVAMIRAASAEYPVVQWDAARGVTPVLDDNGKPLPLGASALQRAGIKADATVQFVDAMVALAALPEMTIVLAHNAHRQLQSAEPYTVAAAVQAVANLRDQFKRNFRMLILMGPLAFSLPSELEQDVATMTHALPDEGELATLVTDLYNSVTDAKLAKPSEETVARAVNAVSGLTLFASEQNMAMSLGPNGLDIDALWEHKRVTIEQTDGLSVYRGHETLDDLRGLTSVKERLRAHKASKTPVGVVVWIDEGSDVFASVETDTSGVKTDQQKVLLVEMEQNNWRGMIFVGVPGSGKSAAARAFGNEVGVPEIAVDFGAMESRYVGDSEAKLRQAIQVIKRVGQGHAFFVLTCNSLRGIRPQFMRRFRRGVFFFDLPTREEKDAIWALYRERYHIPADDPRPDDDAWTGAEIRECCEAAWDTGCTLAQAARFIIPVARSRAQEIDAMRQEAHGRFLDANRPGAYQYAPQPMERSVRAIALDSHLMAAIQKQKES
ncbi:MAG TPA: AAA family ATPase [Burkholderiaceae bacterium]|nr:AAA family ATPase [Burkholderiaceae bacterium]